jgi:transcriptional regulator with XRE-family HTH domain
MNKDVNNELARKKLNNYLEESGMKLKFVAEQLGFNYGNLSHWKQGNRNYSREKLNEIEAWLTRATATNDTQLLKEVLAILESSYSNMEQTEYEMVIQDNKGKRIVKFTRQQYLQFLIDMAVEQLGQHSSFS